MPDHGEPSTALVLDPKLFEPGAIDAETASVNAAIADIFHRQPPIRTLSPQELRRREEQGGGLSGAVRLVDSAFERTIPGHEADVRLRIMIPERVRGIFLHIHGGGFVIGDPKFQDIRNWQIARHCGVAVVSVGYRLAPEHPYPAAVNDCEAAALWVFTELSRQFGVTAVIIGGESAGATLSVATLVRLRDRYGLRAAGALLLYGWYDLTLTPSASLAEEQGHNLCASALHYFAGHYVRQERRREPDVSPAFANLADLCPGFFTVGTLDPLLDDTVLMGARWIAHRNKANVMVYPGGVHGFNALPTPIARDVNQRVEAFVIRCLERAPSLPID